MYIQSLSTYICNCDLQKEDKYVKQNRITQFFLFIARKLSYCRTHATYEKKYKYVAHIYMYKLLLFIIF
jgi:hypothetical protein